MKKAIVKFLVFAGLFLSLGVRSQTVIPTSSYTPRFNFTNLDNKQVWNVIADLYELMGGGSGSVVASFKDIQNNDSITARLRRGLLGVGALGNQFAYLDRVDSGIDTVNSTLRAIAQPVSSSTYAVNYSATASYTNGGVVKASAGNVYGFSGYNSSTSAQFIQLHNKSSIPVDGVIPEFIFLVPALSSFSFNSGNFPYNFNVGVVWTNSSTGPTKTIGSSNIWMNVNYK